MTDVGLIKNHIDQQNADHKWDTFSATMMTSGDFAMAGIDVPTEELMISAWQYLIDSGAVWQLQGSYVRMAVNLIEGGVCLPPPQPDTKDGSK